MIIVKKPWRKRPLWTVLVFLPVFLLLYAILSNAMSLPEDKVDYGCVWRRIGILASVVAAVWLGIFLLHKHFLKQHRTDFERFLMRITSVGVIGIFMANKFVVYTILILMGIVNDAYFLPDDARFPVILLMIAFYFFCSRLAYRLYFCAADTFLSESTFHITKKKVSSILVAILLVLITSFAIYFIVNFPPYRDCRHSVSVF